MPNRIIVPANFTFEVILRVDPVNGQSEMVIRNRSGRQITMWQVAGLLVTHASNTINSLLTTGKVQETPIPDNTVEPLPESKPNGGENAS